MSNDGLTIENMDLSHIHLAVCFCFLQNKGFLSIKRSTVYLLTIRTATIQELLLLKNPMEVSNVGIQADSIL